MIQLQSEPLVRVGIIEAPRVRYIYKGVERVVEHSEAFEAVYLPDGPFTLCDVTIGKQFHWEQQEDQTFVGALRIIADGSQLIAINEVPLEDYLASVISSEMAATNNLELLKAHAIISRSWVMRQLQGSKIGNRPATAQTLDRQASEEEMIKWWDHDDHQLYDVCADDHCQRYQGVTRQVSPLVAEAIRQTRGLVLLDSDDEVCDARFYKACGGHTERFSACWQERDYHYLQPTADPYCAPEFIAQLPGGLDGVMQLVLNSYDRSTIDYHDWTEHYTAEELSELVARKLQLDLGRILQLEPLERGDSGRIIRLRIVGTERTIVIGKELLIRKALSESHLKSSWFDVTPHYAPGSQHPVGFTLHGHGWGHGVGLCQIGAAAMSLAGFSHEAILAHYYNAASITRLYD